MERPAFWRVPNRRAVEEPTPVYSKTYSPQQQHTSYGLSAGLSPQNFNGYHHANGSSGYGSSPTPYSPSQTYAASPISPHKHHIENDPEYRKINFGSPASEAGLRQGDVLMKIGDKSTQNPMMSHADATNLIKNAGNELQVTIARGAKTASPLPYSPPVLRQASEQPAAPLYRPLPSSATPHHVGMVPSFHTVPGELGDNSQYQQEKEREKTAVTNQVYRSSPLILPSPKPSHVHPTGSYLRLMQDPTYRAPAPKPMQTVSPTKLQEVMTKFQHNLGPDSKVIIPYNSPLNMYSNEAISEVLDPNASPAPSLISAGSSGRPSPMPGHHLGPIPQNMSPPRQPADITQSPTYKLIQEQEQAKEHKPVKEKLYVITSTTPVPLNEQSHYPSMRCSSPRPHSPQPHSGEFPQQSRTLTALYKGLLQSPGV